MPEPHDDPDFDRLLERQSDIGDVSFIHTYHAENEPLTVHLRDEAVAGLRTTFVRLDPLGYNRPHQTVLVAHADVDLDLDGRLIGITLVFNEPDNT